MKNITCISILAKTELLVFPANLTAQHNFIIQLGASTIIPLSSIRNLEVVCDVQLTFKDHTVKTDWSCRSAFHNIKKIWLFLMKYVAQLLEKNFNGVKVTTLEILSVKIIPYAHWIMLWADEPWHPRIWALLLLPTLLSVRIKRTDAKHTTHQKHINLSILKYL